MESEFSVEIDGRHADCRVFAGKDFDDRTMEGIDFSCGNFAKASFRGATFLNCDFSYGNYAKTLFSSAEFRNCDFTGSHFYKAVFDDARFFHCDFTGCSLTCEQKARAEFSSCIADNGETQGRAEGGLPVRYQSSLPSLK